MRYALHPFNLRSLDNTLPNGSSVKDIPSINLAVRLTSLVWRYKSEQVSLALTFEITIAPPGLEWTQDE